MDRGELYFFVEGAGDQEFFERGLARVLLGVGFKEVRTVPYASRDSARTNGMLRAIRTGGQQSYLVIADMDNSPCVTEKKRTLRSRFPEAEADRIVVVRREIESWCAAGITDRRARRLFESRSYAAAGYDQQAQTDHLTKESFYLLKPRRYRSRIAWFHEVVRAFDINEAKTRNASFRYFLDKRILVK